VHRTLPDGRHAEILPLTFGRARIIVARSAEWMMYDDGW